MPHYLLSIYQPTGKIPPPDVLGPVMQELDALNKALRAAGAWVFSGGLHTPDTATVVRFTNGEFLTTDGPFAEGKEHLGGFTIVDAPDLDAALEWAKKLTRATRIRMPNGEERGLPIEVRPFQHAGHDAAPSSSRSETE